jgi:hypothetical protein
MSDPNSYASSMMEDSLGLVRGQLRRYPPSGELVGLLTATLRGSQPADVSGPFLEDAMMSLLEQTRSAALRDDGFFVRKARWPGGAPFAVCLTHDVDNIARPKSHLWKTRSRFGFGDLIGGLLGIVKVYDNVELIAAKEKERGFRSSFYFLSANYDLKRVKGASDRIRDAGWDVGLHGDFGTHDSFEKMEEAVSRFNSGLGFAPKGLREHYLRFDFAKSWDVMERAGFEYDTTVGTNDKIGFKTGLASPFNPPSDSWAPMKLLEIPLVLMDTTLWGYLKLTEEQGASACAKMTESVRKVEGLLTLLWHQEAVRMKGGRIYWKLLDGFKAAGCFVATGVEVTRWWKSRSVPLVQDGKLIRLEGEPPQGLVLRVDVAKGHSPKVLSGKITGQGPYFSVTPSDGSFSMEMA